MLADDPQLGCIHPAATCKRVMYALIEPAFSCLSQILQWKDVRHSHFAVQTKPLQRARYSSQHSMFDCRLLSSMHWSIPQAITAFSLGRWDKLTENRRQNMTGTLPTSADHWVRVRASGQEKRLAMLTVRQAMVGAGGGGGLPGQPAYMNRSHLAARNLWTGICS